MSALYIGSCLINILFMPSNAGKQLEKFSLEVIVVYLSILEIQKTLLVSYWWVIKSLGILKFSILTMFVIIGC